MNREQIPDEVRRFILASVPSVPFLEAMLLLRRNAAQDWDSKLLATRLYLSERSASELLGALHAAGVLAMAEDNAVFRYHPVPDSLRQMIDLLADSYAYHLVEISSLIHSKTGKRTHQFEDVFKRRKDS
ncbi:hypothetical protein [Noviherbaspirillum sp.]|uniref:hypothetical protein n=1 Tax=Noviherbaspirillum sp. TaxID=1926288 RepID=UPI002B4964F7|nr:hypothetical protein [Noviherbaspirillum sp.]HJV83736.1 hypothetical protein [Noviherbaspirillum sp.]